MIHAGTFVLETLDRRLHLTAVVEEPQPSMVIVVEGNYVSVELEKDAPDHTAFPEGEPSGVVIIEWHGQPIEMVHGEWIVGLINPGSTYDEQTGHWTFNGVFSRDTNPTPSLDAALDPAEAIGVEFGRYLGSEDAFLITVPDGVTSEQLLDALDDIPDFRYLEPNGIFRAMPVAGDVNPAAPDADEPATKPQEPAEPSEFGVSRDTFGKDDVRGGNSTWEAFNAGEGDELLSEPSADALY